MKELYIEALVENLDKVLAFVDECLEECDCDIKTMMSLDIAVEEIFVNIASYAYGDKNGMAKITLDIDDARMVKITFVDQGIPYNPLDKPDPDITLSVDERPIGGLGIYMVKKSMDYVNYEYKDDSNVFTIGKQL